MTIPSASDVDDAQRQVFDRDDARYLRSELLFRMAVQNAVLVLNVLVFLWVASLQTGRAQNAASLGCAYCLAALTLAAIWCHHGARQAQIKRYLLLLQQRAGVTESWEAWLPRHRFSGRLGARWVVSTKLPLVATTSASCILGLMYDRGDAGSLLAIANIAGICLLAALLWTNPKEGLPSSTDFDLSGAGRDPNPPGAVG